MIPKLTTKVIRESTKLINIEEISESINRFSIYVVSYISYMLKSKMYYNSKTNSISIYGSYDSTELQNLLDKFIEKYVTCQFCKSIETTIDIIKKEIVIINCKECGYNTILDDRDIMTKYFIKYY